MDRHRARHQHLMSSLWGHALQLKCCYHKSTGQELIRTSAHEKTMFCCFFGSYRLLDENYAGYKYLNKYVKIAFKIELFSFICLSRRIYSVPNFLGSYFRIKVIKTMSKMKKGNHFVARVNWGLHLGDHFILVVDQFHLGIILRV